MKIIKMWVQKQSQEKRELKKGRLDMSMIEFKNGENTMRWGF